MSLFPEPHDPLPWHREDGKPTVYSAKREPVSFSRQGNGEYLFQVQQAHDPLVSAAGKALKALQARRLHFGEEEVIASLVFALTKAGVKVNA
jgi:hypothetical protein